MERDHVVCDVHSSVPLDDHGHAKYHGIFGDVLHVLYFQTRCLSSLLEDFAAPKPIQLFETQVALKRGSLTMDQYQTGLSGTGESRRKLQRTLCGLPTSVRELSVVLT